MLQQTPFQNMRTTSRAVAFIASTALPENAFQNSPPNDKGIDFRRKPKRQKTSKTGKNAKDEELLMLPRGSDIFPPELRLFLAETTLTKLPKAKRSLMGIPPKACEIPRDDLTTAEDLLPASAAVHPLIRTSHCAAVVHK